MRIAVLSDVHSNLEALTAVLAHIGKKEIRKIYFVGDAVGYGPDPEECLRILRATCDVFLAGNHDYGACGLTNIEYFNPYARAAIEWTAQVMSAESLQFLKSLEVSIEIAELDSTFVHATPCEPLQWRYLFSAGDAEENFSCFSTGTCFLGHSHRPMIIEQEAEGRVSVYETGVRRRPGCRYIVNAGSVGQPRDGDPRASYVIADSESLEIQRVHYDMSGTQGKMGAARLPEPLIRRLSVGR